MNTFQLNVAEEDSEGLEGDTVEVLEEEYEEDDELVAEDYEVSDEGETEDEEEEFEEVADDEDQDYEEDDGGRPGIDEVIRLAEEEGGKGYADVIRDFARNSVQNAEARADLRSVKEEYERELEDVRSLREELLSAVSDEDEEQEEFGPTDEDLLKDVDPEQLKLLDAYVRENGFIRQTDLEEDEKLGDASEIEAAGVDLFGELFGEIDEDGEFELNPELKEELAPEYRRLVEDQNLTFYDLFKLSNFDEILEAAMEAGYEEGVDDVKSNSTNKIEKVKRASRSSSNSSSGSSARGFYNRDDKDLVGKSGAQKIESVMSKIFNEYTA